MRGQPTPGKWTFERQDIWTENAKILGKPLAEHEGYFRENNGDWIIGYRDGEMGGRIAAVTFKGKAKRGQGYNTPDPEGQANARLIAAAKELVEVLEITQRSREGNFADGWTIRVTGHEMLAIQAAIKKAKGE